jgi:hypothetical protein
MPNNSQNSTRNGEKGAALVTAILISLIVMTLAGALLLTTSMSTTNAVSATDEAQAYYAAEAGLQASLNVLRGNIAPHPNDGTKINFKNAIKVTTSNNPGAGVPQLSRWLVYNYPSSGTPDRVTLSPGYTEANGTAFSITGISDPDNVSHVIYYTAGAFNGGSVTTSPSSASGLPGGVTLTYTPQPTTDVTLTGNLALGSLKFGGVKGSTSIDFSTTITTLTLQITETSPSIMGSSAAISVSITGKLRGVISSTASTVYVDFTAATVEIPSVGTIFTPVLTSNGGVYSFTLPADNATYSMATTVTFGEPARLVIKVHGYGPHGASKNLQAMVSRFGINYDPLATFVIRGHDDSATSSTIDIGSSAQFIYSGIDNSLQGQPLPAFLVTNSPDYTTLSNLKTNNNLPVTGDPYMPIRLVTIPSQISALPLFLQSTSDPVTGARAFVQQLRQQSTNQYFGCSGAPNPGCDRYFNTRAGDSQPADFGMSQPNGLFTFIDGDATLPNEGGRGLLIVTGTLNVSGSKPFEGLVLVLGDGVINRSGAGNSLTLGAFVLARFGSTGGFVNPSFTSSGSGTSAIQLDRSRVQKALLLGGVYTMAVSEF